MEQDGLRRYQDYRGWTRQKEQEKQSRKNRAEKTEQKKQSRKNRAEKTDILEKGLLESNETVEYHGHRSASG